MSIHWSRTTNGFYHSDIISIFPEDAMEITPDIYASLMTAQSAGKMITSDADGHPVAAARPINTQVGKAPIDIDALQTLVQNLAAEVAALKATIS